MATEIQSQQSQTIALVRVATRQASLRLRAGGPRRPVGPFLGVDAVPLGGDAVLAIPAGLRLSPPAPVTVRALRNHDHPEALDPDRIQQPRMGP